MDEHQENQVEAAETAEKTDDNLQNHEEKRIAELEAEVDKYRDQLVRAMAEADNIRKMSERDIEKAYKFGNTKLLGDILPVVDSLHRALQGDEPVDETAKSYREGMQLTQDMLLKVLEKHSVETIAPAVGEAFNPDMHEAMTMLPSPDHGSNTIIEVLENGYQLNGRVLRAARVVVAQ